jgi:murein DD-endopeptidase MepM/ murein hydrolase activator NlpD
VLPLDIRRAAAIGIAGLLALTALAACGARPPAPTPPVPTATQTPAPTAVPLALVDGVTRPVESAPAPAPGAPCGLVDTLDFPLGPPDGDGFAARWPFDRKSQRYDGRYHAGEDWVARRGDTLGTPVHAIGHGQVVYAQPFGWGQVDRGVVIVRHVFPDGETKLSFYGHVQPDSVQLRPGQCVVRGQQVALVDKPRGRPHLHFELRDHMPNEPGPGYWPQDPRTVGWYPPSAYIDAFRTGITPGVSWVRPFTTTDRAELVGALADGSAVLHDVAALFAVDPDSGVVRWRSADIGPVAEAIVDAGGEHVYAADVSGAVHALARPAEDVAERLKPSANRIAAMVVGVRPDDAARAPAVAAAWSMPAPGSGGARLVPLPGSGVGVFAEHRLTGYAPDGTRRWALPDAPAPADWLLAGDRLVLSANGPDAAVYTLTADGALAGPLRPGGQPVSTASGVVLYRSNGLYAFDPQTLQERLLHALEPGPLREGQALAAPGGGVLVAHRGASERELLRFDADGTLRWRRSIAALGTRVPRLVVAGGQVYALTNDGELYRLDLERAAAQRVFGRAAPTGAGTPRVTAIGPRLLVDLRAGYVVAFDGPAPERAGSAPSPGPRGF